jgi:argininosuccinate lyase
MVDTLTIDAARLEEAAGRAYSTATDLADWLVQTLGLPFRAAHHITGRIVKLAEEQGIALEVMPLADMHLVEPRITADIYSRLGAAQSVASRVSEGGTAPSRVLEQIAYWRKRLA